MHHSILWTPRGAAEDRVASTHPPGAYPLFFEHDALAGVNRHLDRAEREPRFGFLLGHLYRDPDNGVEFAVADTAVAAREVLSEEASGAYLIRAWSEAQAVFSGHTGLLLGWYHSHYRLGLAPSEADLETSSRYFGAPWQLSVIVVPDRARPLGGVFRSPGAGEAGSHAVPAAFYEILPAPHGGDIQGAESAVPWANYEARAPILPTAGPPAGEPGASKETPRSTPPGPAPEKGSPDPPVATSPSPSAETPEQSDAPGPETPDRTGPPGVSPAGPAPGESAEPSLPPRPERRRSGPGPRVTLWEDEERPARQKGVAMPQGGAPPGDRLAAVPLVIPGEKAEATLLPPRSRRIGWPVVAVAVIAVAAALYFLLPDFSSPRTRSALPEAPASSSSPELRRLRAEVEALGTAGERYAERAGDFDAGRIGCELLATGYVAADEAYVRVAAAYRDLASQANPQAATAYERAGEEMAEVNSHFDRSGCPRP